MPSGKRQIEQQHFSGMGIGKTGLFVETFIGAGHDHHRGIRSDEGGHDGWRTGSEIERISRPCGE